MSQLLPSPLPLFDRTLLRAVERVVPSVEREEWSRTWQAELWYIHHRRCTRRKQRSGVSLDLSIGLIRDAFWLRTDSWRRAFSGTATLCLASLLGLCLIAAAIALVLNGSWHSFEVNLSGQFKRFLLEVPLVVFVAFATASRRHSEKGSATKRIYWVKRQLFFGAKVLLTLLLAFLLSSDVCQPISTRLLGFAEFLQICFFSIVFALAGLSWAVRDQGQRCKQCLRTLATPARVGRPSHNLLEWNGTELICAQGHGVLSVPEMETSWCRSSQWVVPDRGWDEAASA